jgi:hypothetical protein
MEFSSDYCLLEEGLGQKIIRRGLLTFTKEAFAFFILERIGGSGDKLIED